MAQEFKSMADIIKDPAIMAIFERGAQKAKELRMNNSMQSGTEIKYECDICQDEPLTVRRPMIDPVSGKRIASIRTTYGAKGVIIKQETIEQTEDVLLECVCAEWKKARRILQQSGIEKEFLQISFADYKTEGKHPLFEKAKNVSEKYARDFKSLQKDKYNGLFLSGEAGAGKTTLLISVGNTLMANKIPVLYFQHREEFDKLKANNFHGSDELYERLKNFPGLLLWDDLFKTTRKDERGNRKANDWEVDASWTIINYRIFKDLPIAFSTEWRPAELINLDRSIAGRMFDRCKDSNDEKNSRVIVFRLSKEEKEQGLNPMTVFDHRFMRHANGG